MGCVGMGRNHAKAQRRRIGHGWDGFARIRLKNRDRRKKHEEEE